jgi:hypothetical protein
MPGPSRRQILRLSSTGSKSTVGDSVHTPSGSIGLFLLEVGAGQSAADEVNRPGMSGDSPV